MMTPIIVSLHKEVGHVHPLAKRRSSALRRRVSVRLNVPIGACTSAVAYGDSTPRTPA